MGCRTRNNHTVGAQVFTAKRTGIYKFEAAGAQGGNISLTDGSTLRGGRGGRTVGSIKLNAGQVVYVYVGKQGNTFNGGGTAVGLVGSGSSDGYMTETALGGGATDFRLVGGDWDDPFSLNSRIMVAAGGGGAMCYFRGSSGSDKAAGGAAGGTSGSGGTAYTATVTGVAGGGGGPTEGGSSSGSASSTAGDFGTGGNGASGNWMHNGGSGGGGSSYISGMKGCRGITPKADGSRTLSNHSIDDTALIFYDLFGSSATWWEGYMIQFTDPTMNEGTRNGDGYAIITFVE